MEQYVQAIVYLDLKCSRNAEFSAFALTIVLVIGEIFCITGKGNSGGADNTIGCNALQDRLQCSYNTKSNIHEATTGIHTPNCYSASPSVALQTQCTAVTHLKLRIKLQVTMIREISCQLMTIQAAMTLQYEQQYYLWSQQNVQQLHRSQTASYVDRGKLLPGAADITLHCNLLQDNQLYQWNQIVHWIPLNWRSCTEVAQGKSCSKMLHSVRCV